MSVLKKNMCNYVFLKSFKIVTYVYSSIYKTEKHLVVTCVSYFVGRCCPYTHCSTFCTSVSGGVLSGCRSMLNFSAAASAIAVGGSIRVKGNEQ